MYRRTRRDFIRTTLAALAGTVAFRKRVWAGDATPPRAKVLAIHGEDAEKMLHEGLERMGGWSRFVRTGGKVTLKVNAAWASTPAQGGNTSPELAKACVIACRKAGAKSVVVPEKSCSPSRKAFEMSGIEKAVSDAGGVMKNLDNKRSFREVKLSAARTLTEAEVAVDVLDTDCLINMPVAKSHGGSILTLGMKNWMGSVNDRGFWHRSGLHQCIADCSTLIQPHLVVIDALRIMLTNGPRGPGQLAYPRQLVFATDPVAADAYAATLFEKAPFDIPHIRLAHEMGIGCGDLSMIDVEHVTV